MDAREGVVATHGWRQSSGIDVIDLAEELAAHLDAEAQPGPLRPRSGLQTKEEVDIAFLAFGAAFDSIGVQSRKISGQSVDEALFFHHFSLRACIGQAGKISDIFERNLHVEAVAADPVSTGPCAFAETCSMASSTNERTLFTSSGGIFHSLA